MSSVRRFSGTKLQQLRESRRLLQHDLADRLRDRGLGTTQATVSRWENGQEPRSYVMAALADELGVKVDELYGDDEDAEAASMAPLAAESDAVAALVQSIRALVREEVKGSA